MAQHLAALRHLRSDPASASTVALDRSKECSGFYFTTFDRAATRWNGIASSPRKPKDVLIAHR